MRQFLIPVLAAAALAGTAVPASAGEVTIRVSAAGLDLTDEADLATMKDRIATAVDKACGKPAVVGLYGWQAVEDCKADGLAKANAALEARRTVSQLAGSTGQS